MTTQSRTGFTGSDTRACSGWLWQREAHAGHRRDDRIMPGGGDRDLVGVDRAAGRVDPDHPPAGGADPRHLAILDDVDTLRIGGAGIAQATASWRATPPRRCSVPPSTGSVPHRRR